MASDEIQAPARLTKKLIAEHLARVELASSLRRQAAAIDREQKPTVEALQKYVQQHGGKERVVLSCGFRLAIESKPKSPRWKDEFISVNGAEMAGKILDTMPQVDRLKIETA